MRIGDKTITAGSVLRYNNGTVKVTYLVLDLDAPFHTGEKHLLCRDLAEGHQMLVAHSLLAGERGHYWQVENF